MMNAPFHVTTLIGTRPEAIKMAPVILALKDHPDYHVNILLSGQHEAMAVDALKPFDLYPDRLIARHLTDFSLASQASCYLTDLTKALQEEPTDLILVHGDTTTGFIGALAAFYLKIPAGHVEAGLRSHHMQNPFPEEANRRLIDPLCQLLFAPTQLARANLLREGIDSKTILVTGNTVVDSIKSLATRLPALSDYPMFEDADLENKRIVLVTTHRRENWGAPMASICRALQSLVDRYDDLVVILPVHPNPQVQNVVRPLLSGHPRMILTEPLDYEPLIAALRDAYLTLTDSGGIQEEAPSVATPVLVLREVTERPEAVEAGLARLVGTDTERIVSAASELLDDPTAYQAMIAADNPFGDGKAGDRIVQAIENWRAGQPWWSDTAAFQTP
jgi:UDP-N-acetylglucosamine 2-epimerase (non-hydrolysing)